MFFASSIPIVACSSAQEIKGAISIFCKLNDSVLELGTELSDVSMHLCRTIGSHGTAVLVDKKRSLTKNTQTVDMFLQEQELHGSHLFGTVEFMELDELSEWRNNVFVNHSYHVLILSVAHILGNDLYMTTLSLASDMLGYSQPRAIIIKSKALYSLSRRLVHSQRLFDGTTTLPTTMKRSNKPILIASVKVEEYRKTIPFVVQSADEVLEVGCHFGRTTHLLHKTGKYCIGVDIGPKIIAHAKKQYPEIPFAIGDAWRTLDLLKLQKNHSDQEFGYDVVYADIGGLSGADGHLESLSLLESLGNAFEPRCIVIKSLCMRQLASCIKFFPDVWKKYHSSNPVAPVEIPEMIEKESQSGVDSSS